VQVQATTAPKGHAMTDNPETPQNPSIKDAGISAPARVAALIEQYQQEHDASEDLTDPASAQSVLADLVADILHYANAHNADADRVFALAREHYEAEYIDRTRPIWA